MDNDEIIISGETLYGIYIEELFSNIRHQEIIKKLNDIFEDYISVSGQQRNMIEILVDEYYFEYIKYFKAKLTNQLEENLEESANILSKRIENDSNDKDKALDYFQQMINPNRFRNYVQNFLDEINDDFLRNFTSQLTNRFEVLDSNIEEIIRYDIGSEVKRYLERIAEKFYDDFRRKIIIANQFIYQRAQETIDDYEISKPQQEAENSPSIDEINEYAQLFGYTIKQRDNKIIIESINNAHASYEVKPINNGFMSVGKEKAGIIYNNNVITFYDGFRHEKVEYDTSTYCIKMGSLNEKYENSIYEIKYNNGKVEILYAGKILDDPSKQSIVINEIKNKYPNVFNKLLEKQDISSAIDEVQKQYSKKELYKKDENTDYIRKVPENFEELQKRIFIAGYQLEEIDGILYAVDMKTNAKDRLIDKEYGLILENNPNVCIAIDLAIIHTDRIHTNLMQIYDLKKHTHFLITPDFKHFLSSEVDIHIEKDGVKYENTTMSEDEIIQFLSENYPNVLTFINSNTKWSEFSIPKKESVDVSKFKSVEPEKGKQLKEESTKEELLAKIAQLEKENEFLKRQNQQLMQSQQQTPNVAPIL